MILSCSPQCDVLHHTILRSNRHSREKGGGGEGGAEPDGDISSAS